MRSFSRSAATAFMVRTILALVPRFLMGAFVSHFQTQALSTDLSSPWAWRTQRLSSVDMILPAIETQRRRDSLLGYLGDYFVFDRERLAHDLLNWYQLSKNGVMGSLVLDASEASVVW